MIIIKSENAQHFQEVLCELDEDAWGANLKMEKFHHFLCLNEAKGMFTNMKMRSIFSRFCANSEKTHGVQMS